MTVDEAKKAMDAAISDYAVALREGGALLTGYHLVLVSTAYSDLGTGSAWYNWATLPGQQHHVTAGLAQVGQVLLDHDLMEGGDQ